jgi:hypothetical protein
MKTRWFRRIAVLTLAGTALIVGGIGQQSHLLPGYHPNTVIAGGNPAPWPPAPEFAALS